MERAVRRVVGEQREKRTLAQIDGAGVGAVLRADRKDRSPLFLALSRRMQSDLSAVRARGDNLDARSFETRKGVFDAPPPAKRAGLHEE